jgi:hypothetical protein
MKTETEMIAAVLHDIVEDGGITIDDLRGPGIQRKYLMQLNASLNVTGRSIINLSIG